MPAVTPTTHRFRFFRAGGVDQVVLDEGVLRHLSSLDEKLWLALACPTRGLELDPRTLDLIDTDKDGRIRPPEVLAAVAWATTVFADLSELFTPLPDDELPLASFADNEVARAVLAGAKRILHNLGRDGDTSIRLADVTDTERLFALTKLNGDGVVPVDATDDVSIQKMVGDVLAVMGAVQDRSGAPGIDKAKADAFFDQVDALVAWLGLADETVRVIGEATDAAVTSLAAVRAKIDDYFVRARLAAYGDKLGPVLDASMDAAALLGGKELASEDDEVARWPLSHVVAEGALPLTRGVNPAWAKRLRAFVQQTWVPLGGASKDVLTEADWTLLKDRLAPFVAWSAARPDVPAFTLGPARLLELVALDARQKVAGLIAEDAALEAENSQNEAVEQAIRFRRDLVPFLRNFINFADFYGKRCGIFQIGTLYIDGRSCDLVLPVHDVAKHAALAGLAKAYLIYCDCTRKGQEKRTIVAAVTGGHVDNILVGRNGVFYDRKGDDWDATITKILENPISVRQAFLSPYKRFVRTVEEQVAKRAAAADAKSNQAMESHATNVATADATAAAPAHPPPPAAVAAPVPEKKIDIGTVAAIGVAVGGIATFFSSVLATFFGLGMWMPVGILGLLLAISGPSMLIAWLKLRQRNIGPILDANGWAVNAFARMNVPFGAALTETATLPTGAIRILDDPFAEQSPRYGRWIALAIVIVLAVLWGLGKLDWFLPSGAQCSTLLHHAVPASTTVR